MSRTKRLERDLSVLSGIIIALVVALLSVIGWSIDAALSNKGLLHIGIGTFGFIVIGVGLWYIWLNYYRPLADELEGLKDDE